MSGWQAALALLVTGLLSCGGTPVTPTSGEPGQRAPAATSAVLLWDDFAGASLDTTVWFVPIGDGTFIGRTQLRPPTVPLRISDGMLRLQLDTFNPTARVPGDSFWGSEIVTRQLFERGGGLTIRARVRLVPPVLPGMVGSLFSYTTRGGVRDEIDFELITNDGARGDRRILTNAFDDDPFSVAGQPRFATLPGPDLTQFNELEIQWLPDRVRWLVNGTAVREETTRIPDEPMSVRLNFWAPSRDFADAFDDALTPVASANRNQSFFYEVDFVEVRRVQPE
jgi:beta-glucanase (GH16 family)